MYKILLVCANGMSTSLLVERMKDKASASNLEVEIRAVGEHSIHKIREEFEFECILVGPQIRYMLKKINEKWSPLVPVELIDMKDYGTMNGEKVLQRAIELIHQKNG